MRCPVCKGTADVTPSAGAPFTTCDRCVDGEITLRAGTRFEICGLIGEARGDLVWLEIDSVTHTCQLNASLHYLDGEMSLVTVGAADLVASIEQGWLVPS